MLLAGYPVLDVEVGSEFSRLQPSFPGVEAAEDIVGRVVDSTQARTVDVLHDLADTGWTLAVNGMLVLMQEPHACRRGSLRLGLHAPEHLVAPVLPVIAIGKVIAEDADIGHLEHLAQLDGSLQPRQRVLKRLIELRLAYW